MDNYVVTLRTWKGDLFRYYETVEECREFIELWEEFEPLEEVRISQVIAVDWRK